MNTTAISTTPPPSDPLAFIAVANQRGAAPEEIQKYIDLYERVTAIRAEVAYTEAMRRCQERMPIVIKTATNAHTGKNYAQFENVLAAIKPVYVEEGFALSFGTEESKLTGYFRVVCDVMHVGGKTKRYFGDFPADGQGSQGGKSSMNPIQGIGSMKSYARKYLTFDIFNLTVAGEDTDAARVQVATKAELDDRAAKLVAIKKYIADLDEVEESACYAWMECQPDDLPWQRYDTILKGLKAKAAAKKAAAEAAKKGLVTA